MRDPFYFYDQRNDEEYILCTANAAFKPGPHNGVIGLAQKQDDGTWQLLPPIIGAPEVSSARAAPRRREG